MGEKFSSKSHDFSKVSSATMRCQWIKASDWLRCLVTWLWSEIWLKCTLQCRVHPCTWHENFFRNENWTIIKEVTGFQRSVIFRLLISTEVAWKCWKSVSTWKPHGVYMVTMLCPHGNHMFSMWKPCGFHVKTMWFPCENHILSRWTLHGFHIDTLWFPCGHNMVITWTPHGF